MKVNINVEIDTENKTDISTIEELIELIKKIKEQSDNEQLGFSFFTCINNSTGELYE